MVLNGALVEVCQIWGEHGNIIDAREFVLGFRYLVPLRNAGSGVENWGRISHLFAIATPLP